MPFPTITISNCCMLALFSHGLQFIILTCYDSHQNIKRGLLEVENLKNRVKKGVSALKAHFKETTQDAEQTIIPFAIFCLISHPLFYFMNLYLLAHQDYSNLSLRITISVLCFALALKNYWPTN